MLYDVSDVPSGLNGKEEVYRIKKLCSDRIDKYGLHTLKSGACKSCPYRYRGSDKTSCCMFGDLPYSWEDRSIEKAYRW